MIQEAAFADTYFRDIYAGINGKWYRKSRKNLISENILIRGIIVQIIIMSVSINMVLNAEHS